MSHYQLINDQPQLRIQDFPLGGGDPLGVADLGRERFSVETFAKMKELGPVEGGGDTGGAPRIRY